MMSNRIVCVFLFFILNCLFAFGQIRGKVEDNSQQPVEGATVVMQTLDSTYIGATVTDSDGIFLFEQAPKDYILIIQHLLYHTKEIIKHSADVGTIHLDSKDYNLDEVVIKGERPLVRMKDGKIEYDISALSEKQAVSNAYEAILKLPGINSNNGALSLAGANSLTVIMNGKPTTMTSEQLEVLLRNTPIDRVEKAEVMYSAPPELHVRGAVVNVIIKRSHDYSFQGELSTHYQNKYFNDGGANANIRLSTPKTTLDVMYSADNIKTMEYTDLIPNHTLYDEVYRISQNEQLTSKSWKHNVRTALEYNFNDKSHINIAYTGSFSPNIHNRSIANGSFQQSNLDKFMDNKMHNVSFQNWRID